MNDHAPDVRRTPGFGVRVYSLLLGLYPRAFREEFGEEMMVVHSDLMRGIVPRGTLALLVRSLREYAGLLVGAAREHLVAGGIGRPLPPTCPCAAQSPLQSGP